MGKSLFKVMIWMTVQVYRLSKGRMGGRMGGRPVLLLTTTGRKSGRPRTIPISYLVDGRDYVLAASAFAVLGRAPGWYLNLKSQPRAEIQVGAERRWVTARVAGAEERTRLWARLLEAAPEYGQYQERAARPIAMVILQPVEPRLEEQRD